MNFSTTTEPVMTPEGSTERRGIKVKTVISGIKERYVQWTTIFWATTRVTIITLEESAEPVYRGQNYPLVQKDNSTYSGQRLSGQHPVSLSHSKNRLSRAISGSEL